MAESENKPSIRIHVDQQITIEGVRGQEEVEDETVATEITGFDVEDDLYVLRGALSFSGFFRQAEEDGGEAELPDAFDDRDVFAAGEQLPDAPVLPFHHRLPFLLQVPVTAQEVHQRESGSLYVNPKIGQWNVHVLGEDTIHLRAELILQGLSGQEGYVFRCGTQEEGVKPASKLDHLLDLEESRTLVPPVLEEEEFEAPFDNAWASNYRQHLDAAAEPASEDDWLIESPAPDAQTAQAEFLAEQEADEEDDTILFTPDPRLVFPLPEAVDQATPTGLPLNEQELFEQAQALFEDAKREFPELENIDFAQASREVLDQFQVNDLQALQRNLFEQAEAFKPPFEPYQTYQPPLSSSASDVYHEAYNRIVASHGTPSPADEEAFVVEEADVSDVTELSPFAEARPDEAPGAWMYAGKGADDVRSAVEHTQFQPPVFEASAQPFEQAALEADSQAQAEWVADPADATAAEAAAETAEKNRESHAVQALHEVDQAEAEFDAAHEAVAAVEINADDANDGDEDDRPVLETDSATLEEVYEFEDELPESQVIVSAAPEVVEQPAASGPKLSVGTKSSFDSGTGVKLSSLLGESRPRDLESPTTLGSIVSNNGGNAPAIPAAHAHNIVGNNGGNIAESGREDSIVSNNGGSIEDVPPLYTPSASAHDSVWGNFLRQKETKTTLKFRIVHEQDSLGELAEQYNTTPSELQRVNRLQRQEVEAGQILYIPTKRR